MAYPSYAPARIIEEDPEAPIARPRTKLRFSRMPASFAVVGQPLPLVAHTVDDLGRAVNDVDDELGEDEIFAIWQARLL